MKKKLFTLVMILGILAISMFVITGCGKKTEERIVYATIIIENENENQNKKQTISTTELKHNKNLLNTYEELIYSNAIKAEELTLEDEWMKEDEWEAVYQQEEKNNGKV